MTTAKQLRVRIAGGRETAAGAIGEVSALLMMPAGAKRLLVLGHGAGAGMKHPFLEALAGELATVGLGTLRYQFPYMEERRRVPDAPGLLLATVAAAVRTAREAAPGVELLAGGKSMGGRMTSQAAAEGLLDGVCGLVFFGFPLHPPGKVGTKRAEHLARVRVPMLFVQGTRDTFAEMPLLRGVCARLGDLATLYVVEAADHSFHVLKSAGKTDAEVLRELAKTTEAWAARIA
jgi:predicted alpha/beta-hydrolase family hydrolase